MSNKRYEEMENEKEAMREKLEQGRYPRHLCEKLQHFRYMQLPPKQREISQVFHELAFKLADSIDSCPELTISLDKLREAKDRAVTASFPNLIPENV